MAKRDYDRIMVHTKIGTNRKVRRLTPAERWAFVAGVCAIAGESPLRGALLIAEGIPAEASDVAGTADVPLPVAKRAMESLRQLGMLTYDEESGCEWVHDFDEWNPAPKGDATAAERMRRHRERVRNARNGNGTVTRNVTPDSRNVTPGSKEGEELEVTAVSPPSSRADVEGTG